MIFSIVSIVSSIFDYKLSSLLIKCEAITVIEMNVESRQLAKERSIKFQEIIVHHRNPICQEVAKIIDVNWRLIEILMPIQNKSGAKLTFYIRHDSTEANLGSNIVKTIQNEIDSGSLAKVT